VRKNPQTDNSGMGREEGMTFTHQIQLKLSERLSPLKILEPQRNRATSTRTRECNGNWAIDKLFRRAIFYAGAGHHLTPRPLNSQIDELTESQV